MDAMMVEERFSRLVVAAAAAISKDFVTQV